jgi:GTP-binding protein EngB required for normal cell division
MNGVAAQVASGPGRSDLAAVAQQVAALLAGVGFDELQHAAATEAARLRAGVCTLAVVGEFKRGKSTLINALLGADLLPVAAVPLTAVGTHVEFGPSTQAIVEFRDGRLQEIDATTIADYVTERGNPGNARGVAGVVITMPAPWLRAPLRVLDTPGIGSAFADVSATAGDLLAHADAALVVLSAEQPASRRELDFLREVIASGVCVFLVENKMDLVPPRERHEVLEFVRRQVRDCGGDARLDIFACSSEQARQAQRAGDAGALEASGLPALQAALTEFVCRHGANAVAGGVRRRLLRLIDRALSRLELQQQSAPMAREWSDQRRARMEQRVNVELFRDLLDAKTRIATAAQELIVEMSMAAPEQALVHRLEALLKQVPVWRSSQTMRQWAIEVESHACTALEAVINQWSAAERDVVAAAAREHSTVWSERAGTLLAPIVGPLPALIPPTIDPSPPVVPLPSLRLSRPPLLPGVLGRRQVRRRLWRWLRSNLLTALEARRAAIDASLAATLRHAEDQFHRQLTDLTNRTIAAIAANPAPVAAPLDAPVAELRRLRTELKGEIDGC